MFFYDSRTLAVLTLIAAVALAALDAVSMGIVLPAIGRSFGSTTGLTWSISIYTVAAGLSTPVWGKMVDIRERRACLLFALLLFALGSLGAALSVGSLTLATARLIQGIGSAGMSIVSLALVQIVVPTAQRPRYQGIVAVTMVLALLGGPFLFAMLSQYASWRDAFLINCPLAFIDACLLWHSLPKHPAQRNDRQGIDSLGTVLLMTMLGPILVSAFTSDRQRPALLALALFAALALVWHTKHGRHLIIPRAFLRNHVVLCSGGMAFIAGLALFVSVTYVPVSLQMQHGATALQSALSILPVVVGLIGASQFAIRFYVRFPHWRARPILFGACCLPAAFLTLGLNIDGGVTLRLSACLLLLGIGFGCLAQTCTMLAQESVADSDIGAATAWMSLMRMLGGAFGVSAFHRTADVTGSASSAVLFMHAAIACLAGLAFSAGLVWRQLTQDRHPSTETVPDAKRALSG